MAEAETAGPEARWRAHLAEGRFMIQREAGSGRAVFPPRPMGPGTGGALEWVEASGRGEVHAVTVMRRRPEQGGDLGLCLVELEEGPRMMSRVVDMEPGEVRIGLAVRARIEEVEGELAVVFAPEGGA